MALSQPQIADATKVYNFAVSQGLPPARARELVLAAFHEGGLDPNAVNKQSGAAGDFQLLSPGYRTAAAKLGGLFSTDANEGAILPDYKRYWQQHPDAAPGEAAAAVERSGEGAGYYSAGNDLLGFLGGKGATGAPQPPAGIPPAGPAPISPDARTQFALTIAKQIGSHQFDPGAITGALAQLHASEQAQPTIPPDEQPAGQPAGPGGNLHARFGVPVADLSSVSGVHPTEGLAGFPAHDYFAPAGSTVVAPITGTVIRLSGHSPTLGPIEGPHGPLGWSVYIRGADGRTYYLTHLGSRNVKVGDRLRTGEPIGTVADYAKYGTPSHVHMGVGE